MKWQVAVRIGLDDNAPLITASDAPRIAVSLARAGDSGRVQQQVIDQIEASIGRRPPALAEDLLNIAIATFAIDTRIPRAVATDGWTREIAVKMPVSDPSAWNGVDLQSALEFLTGDIWSFEFRTRESTSTSVSASKKEICSIEDVELFSGGLDSLAGALNLLSAGRTVALAGHYGAGVTNSVQQSVLTALQAQYPEQIVSCMFHVQPIKAARQEGEQSMRSRSLLFLALGVAVATAIGPDRKLTVCENGLISLNVPLTNPRMGTWSTRTTHPHFIAQFRTLLHKLGLKVTIDLPARFKTKGELLSQVSDQASLRVTAPLSMSCSHPEQGRYRAIKPGNHCGYCVPCIVRRASMTTASLPDATYDTDVLTHPGALSVSTRRDLKAFEIAIRRIQKSTPARALFEVLGTGPLPPNEAAEYASVYRRGMDEIASFLGVHGSHP